MRKIAVFLFAILVLSSFGTKGPTFSLSDNSVEIGAVYTLKRNFSKYSNDISTNLEEELKAISKFLSKNTKLKVEISVHSNEEHSDIITAERAKKVASYLAKQGVKRNRLDAIGRGNKRPIITQRELFQYKTLSEKLKAKEQNNRIELKVLELK